MKSDIENKLKEVRKKIYDSMFTGGDWIIKFGEDFKKFKNSKTLEKLKSI